MEYRHRPVLLKEAVEMLGCRTGGIYVDCTLGGGGHAAAILEATAPDGMLLGIDRDGEAIKQAGTALARFGSRARLVRSNFLRLKSIVDDEGIAGLDGILVDLGVSSRQLDTPERGFSFMREGPLDMRMDQSEGESASELMERISVSELEDILKVYGEERFARIIARAIKSAGRIATTTELAGIVENAVPRRLHPKKIHPATRTFQALRIAVNGELEGLGGFIAESAGLLKDGGRMAIISFHSLEDRIVKETFRTLSTGCICPSDLPRCACGMKAAFRLVSRGGVTASEAELAENPRARSARLRGVEKLPHLN